MKDSEYHQMVLLQTGNLYGNDRNDLTSFETLSQKRLVAIYFLIRSLESSKLFPE